MLPPMIGEHGTTRAMFPPVPQDAFGEQKSHLDAPNPLQR